MFRYDIKIIHACWFGFPFHLYVHLFFTVFSQSQLLHLLHFINSFLIKTWWQNIEITIFYQIVTWSKPQAPDFHNKNNLKYPISNSTQGTHLGFISNCHIISRSVIQHLGLQQIPPNRCIIPVINKNYPLICIYCDRTLNCGWQLTLI